MPRGRPKPTVVGDSQKFLELLKWWAETNAMVINDEDVQETENGEFIIELTGGRFQISDEGIQLITTVDGKDVRRNGVIIGEVSSD